MLRERALGESLWASCAARPQAPRMRHRTDVDATTAKETPGDAAAHEASPSARNRYSVEL
jgi:hypothetical protein